MALSSFTATRSPAEIDIRDNRIGIDTGAYRTGVLTAMGLEGRERWFLQTGPGVSPNRGSPEEPRLVANPNVGW